MKRRLRRRELPFDGELEEFATRGDRLDLWDPHHLDGALARFESLGSRPES